MIKYNENKLPYIDSVILMWTKDNYQLVIKLHFSLMSIFNDIMIYDQFCVMIKEYQSFIQMTHESTKCIYIYIIVYTGNNHYRIYISLK